MQIKRKAQGSGGTIGIIGAFVLVFLVVFLIGKWFTGTTADASTSFGSLNLNNRHQLCELAGKKIIERGQEPKEEIEGDKKDNFPDDCDICLGGDDSIVTNSYGIPDACYYPTKEVKGKKIESYKDMCIIGHPGACYISDTAQCCLKYDSGINCPTKCKS